MIILRNIRYFLEGTFLALFFLICKILGSRTASNVGGFLGRNIGARLATSRKAMRNLANAFPELSEKKRKKIIHDMWDNLGRTLAEYPHLEKISKDKTTFVSADIFDELTNAETGAVFFGGHLANWELPPITALLQKNKDIAQTYRPPNNPWADKLIWRFRTLNGRLTALPKERKTGKVLMELLKDNGSVGILIDQKYNEGIPVPFFGQPAMTNPVAVTLAQRYKIPLVPVQTKRLKNGTNFEVIFHPPIALFTANNEKRPVEDILQDAHNLMEDWIREEPAQWLWLHRRWDSKQLTDNSN